MSQPKFYLTTPIYYANSRPHVGSAYTTIVCDVIARYKRMCGYDVAYLTGTDEHGEKIARAAEAAGMQPGDFVAREREHFKSLWRTLGISEYRFVHTSQNPDHVKSVHWMIQQAQKAGYIEKKKYEGRYCIHDERYVSDSTEPIDCDICGRPAELVSEENYFFRLSAFQEKLLDLYSNHPQFVQPEFRLNEVVSFVKGGLRDISISRRRQRLAWGIEWPGDPEHVVYVWYDALTSYLSGIGFRGAERSADFNKYWIGTKEEPTEVVHLLGKDILRFHAVYWPAFLIAAGVPLPKTMFAHGWIYYEKDKMSKSKGNIVYPEPIVQVLDELTGAKVGNDALRYYLLREIVFGQDGNFSREALLTRYNADLANGLGNLANRVLTMIHEYCGGQIPNRYDELRDTHKHITESNVPEAGLAHALEEGCSERPQRVGRALDQMDFSGGLLELWNLVSMSDQCVTLCKPWVMVKDSSKRSLLDHVLYRVAEAVRIISVLSHPVIPDATQRIWVQLGQSGNLADVRIDQLKWGDLKPGTKIGKPEAVFPRVDKQEAWERIEAMENEIRKPATAPAAPPEAAAAPAVAPAAAPATAKITIDDFAKVELRAGVVKSAERIPGADKLLKLQVDIGGDEVRQVLAGIALAYAPDELIGRKVVIVTNLAPRKMRGLESNGMILAASAGPDGKPVLCTFTEDIPAGAKVK